MSNSTESPTSVTYSLVSPNGYPILFTLRDEKASKLLENMATLEKKFVADGYKPQEKKPFVPREKKPQEVVPNRKCPKCGSGLVRGTSSKTGQGYVKCSTQTYDFKTKQTSGCPFFEWNDSTPTKVVENF